MGLSDATTQEIHRLKDEGQNARAIASGLGLPWDQVVEVLEAARPKAVRPAHRTHAAYAGGDLKDPYRADKALRRFSWEQDA